MSVPYGIRYTVYGIRCAFFGSSVKPVKIGRKGFGAIKDPALSRFGYTLGSPLRIPNVKNMGRDLAPKELRICP